MQKQQQGWGRLEILANVSPLIKLSSEMPNEQNEGYDWTRESKYQ